MVVVAVQEASPSHVVTHHPKEHHMTPSRAADGSEEWSISCDRTSPKKNKPLPRHIPYDTDPLLVETIDVTPTKTKSGHDLSAVKPHTGRHDMPVQMATSMHVRDDAMNITNDFYLVASDPLAVVANNPDASTRRITQDLYSVLSDGNIIPSLWMSFGSVSTKSTAMNLATGRPSLQSVALTSRVCQDYDPGKSRVAENIVSLFTLLHHQLINQIF
jgi:hypothetical protein